MKYSVLILLIITLIAIIKVSSATAQAKIPKESYKASKDSYMVKDYFFKLPKTKQVGSYLIRDTKQLPQALQPHFKGVSVQDYIDHGEKPVINDRLQLDLAYMHINDLTGLEHIDHITDTLVLILHHNNLESITPTDVKHVPRLKVLSLHDNKINNVSLGSNLPQLTMLYLYNNNMSTIESFGNLPNVHEITLDHNKISSIAPDAFNRLPNLRRLYLHNNIISKLPVGIFAKLSALQELYIQNNPIAQHAAQHKRIEQEVRNATNGRGKITWHK